MYYAILYGHLPFWGDTEEDFIDKIMHAPVKFNADIPVTNECKEVIKGMLNKDPEKRMQLMEIMETHYFQMENADLETKVEALKK